MRSKSSLILNRDNWTCQLCGVDLPKELRGTFDALAAEVDHVVPRSEGGSDDFSNLRAACRKCNQARRGRNLISPSPAVTAEAKRKHADGSRRGGQRCQEWMRAHPKQAAQIRYEAGVKAGRVRREQGMPPAWHKQARESGLWSKAGKAAHVAKDSDGKSITAKKAGAGRARWVKANPDKILAIAWKSNHTRWHVRRGIFRLGCKLCRESKVEWINEQVHSKAMAA